MKNEIKNIFEKYFGKIEYKVTVVHKSGKINYFILDDEKEVDEIVNEMNGNRYWDVQRIEKYRKFRYTYKNIVIHSPKWFESQDVTENVDLDGINYSFLKQDESIDDVRYQTNKPNDR